MRFCDGNHDDHTRLHELPPVENNVAKGITYQHRGSIHEDVDGCRFLFLGGAPSIDKSWRIQNKAPWWPEEEITEKDMQITMSHLRSKPIDVFVSHDAAWPPPGIKDTDEILFMIKARWSQSCIAKVIRMFQPQLHVHGHYHVNYESQYENTTIQGLASNLQPLDQAVKIYEFDKNPAQTGG
jgi:hypothetical protein